MKLKSIFLMFLAVFISMFLFVDVYATIITNAPSSFTLGREREINASEEIVAVPGDFQAVFFPVKYDTSNNYLVLCTGNRKANINTFSFTSTSFVNDYDGAVVAGIIKVGVGENATRSVNDSSIFFTQLAIWKSLPNTGDSFPSTESSLSANQLQTLNNLVAAGTAAKTRYNNIKNFAISFDATKLNFTLNGDVYESQVIKVTGNEIKSKTPTVDKGTIVEKNGGYVVRINKSQLTNERTTITLNVTATSNSIEVAKNYTNGKTDEQTVTTSQFDKYYNNATKSISGEIVKEPTIVKFSKKDATNNEELAGAHFVVKDANGNIVDEWTSDGTIHTIIKKATGTSLDPGTYTLSETDAPEGYIKSKETITFTVKNDGQVISKSMKNYPKDDIYISKVDATTGEELPGAYLVLKDSKGNVVDEWESGTTPHPVKVKLPAGKYTLTETKAPDGYELSTETIEFTVEEDGTVKEPVIMKNDKIVEPVPTGDALIYFAWLIGAAAIGYSIYYFNGLRKEY